mgnify:CR=1 FL=1
MLHLPRCGLVVRKELADNFCLYQPRYDELAGASAWAQGTLNDHRGDARATRSGVAAHDMLPGVCPLTV